MRQTEELLECEQQRMGVGLRTRQEVLHEKSTRQGDRYNTTIREQTQSCTLVLYYLEDRSQQNARAHGAVHLVKEEEGSHTKRHSSDILETPSSQRVRNLERRELTKCHTPSLTRFPLCECPPTQRPSMRETFKSTELPCNEFSTLRPSSGGLSPLPYQRASGSKGALNHRQWFRIVPPPCRGRA